MPRGKKYDSFKQDSVVLEFLKKHKGKDNILSSKQICTFLNEKGYAVKSDSVHTIIRRIMYERNAPICHQNARGYYWAQTREEIESTIADMESRIASLNEHIEHLRNFVIK